MRRAELVQSFPRARETQAGSAGGAKSFIRRLTRLAFDFFARNSISALPRDFEAVLEMFVGQHAPCAIRTIPSPVGIEDHCYD